MAKKAPVKRVKKAPTNRYKQLAVERPPEPVAEKPVKQHPFFRKGDTVKSVYKPMFFTILKPCVILDITYTNRCVSGFMIKVDTTAGIKELDSSLFSKSTTNERGEGGS